LRTALKPCRLCETLVNAWPAVVVLEAKVISAAEVAVGTTDVVEDHLLPEAALEVDDRSEAVHRALGLPSPASPFRTGRRLRPARPVVRQVIGQEILSALAMDSPVELTSLSTKTTSSFPRSESAVSPSRRERCQIASLRHRQMPHVF